MKTILATALAALLTACGGGGSCDPLVTVNASVQVPGSCMVAVDTTGMDAAGAAEAVHQAVEKVRSDSGQQFAYLIAAGRGAQAALDFMGTHPGKLSAVSLWLPTYDAPSSRIDGLKGSVATITVNAGDDASASIAIVNRMLADGDVAILKQWPGITAFGPAQQAIALQQLGLR